MIKSCGQGVAVNESKRRWPRKFWRETRVNFEFRNFNAKAKIGIYKLS